MFVRIYKKTSQPLLNVHLDVQIHQTGIRFKFSSPMSYSCILVLSKPVLGTCLAGFTPELRPLLNCLFLDIDMRNRIT